MPPLRPCGPVGPRQGPPRSGADENRRPGSLDGREVTAPIPDDAIRETCVLRIAVAHFVERETRVGDGLDRVLVGDVVAVREAIAE